jgi:hypothetical protein
MAVFIVFGIVLRLAAGREDQVRIAQYLEERGGKLLDSKWSPFGTGWWGERGDRIYTVRYLDKDGNENEAHCKTSACSGVYFTEDRIVKNTARPAPPAAQSESALEAENRQLRKELERLRRKSRADPGAASDRQK